MTKTQIRNEAYLIASSNALIEILSYHDLQDMPDDELVKLAWEPFEHWTADELRSYINQVATDIINVFTKRI